MNVEQIKSMQTIARTHAQRITESIAELKQIKSVPFTEHMIKNLTREQLLLTEMLTSRFAKLQDHLGSNVIDLFFEISKEPSERLTMIDKLNKLEKLELIDDAHIWTKMREKRNIIEHEYPDKPELIAATLNEIIDLCPILIDTSNKLFDRINASALRN